MAIVPDIAEAIVNHASLGKPFKTSRKAFYGQTILYLKGLSYQNAHLDSLSIGYNSLYLLQFSHLQWQHTSHEYGRGFQEQIILSVQFQLVLEPMGLDFLCPEIVMRGFYWKLLQIPHFLSYFYHPTHLDCCLILHMQHTYGLPLVQMKVPALYLLQDLQQPSTLRFCKRHIVIILIITV